MQTVASYLLEYPAPDAALATSRKAAIDAAVSDWLASKGVADASAPSGTFQSVSGKGTGVFSRASANADGNHAEEITLDETSPSGARFITTLSVLTRGTYLSLYSRLSTANVKSVIAPLASGAKCPSVIRTLLGQYSDWSFGGYPIPRPQPRFCRTDDDVAALQKELQSSLRTLPILAVSFVDGHAIWPNLAQKLANDLTGLAVVIAIDQQASWTLTQTLGRWLSCYNGALRLYWPSSGDTESTRFIPSTLWAPSALLTSDDDRKAETRFRQLLRRMVMGVAARAISQPLTVADLRGRNAEKRLLELERTSSSMSEEIEIARLYLNDNQTLRGELDNARREIAQLSTKLSASEYALSQVRQAEPQERDEAEAPEADQPPKPGDERYYKKIGSKPGYDVFVQVNACGHSAWQSSDKAEKAKKGFERVFKGRTWKSLHHCGACGGGGLWRIRW